jgi:UDP-N-acetylmuramate: L-alanyl-gamma-D-glutamyl-meso-diaminopimelate ligase
MPDDHPRSFPDDIPAPDDIATIHIIGICGTAMGSLAAMLQQRGFRVRGSDAMAYPPMSSWLAERDIDIMKGYDASNLDWEPDLVIVGNVCREEYGDAVATRERGFPYLSFPEALRYFFFDRQHPLVVTGTHGKTTTTAMLAWMLHHADADPSMFVGGVTGNFQSNYRLGDGEAFVIEGDEYDTAYFDKVPKFWHYEPFRATINNIEYDHADIYDDIETIERMFSEFVDLIPPTGSLWVNGDDERVMRVSDHAEDRRQTFGLGNSNDLQAVDIDYATDGAHTTEVTVELNERCLGTFELPVIGEFNVRNFLGATGLALDEGLTPDQVRQAIAEFRPVKKRQEVIGTVDDVTIIDDFAHHPTAVRSTLEALRASYPERRIWAMFEAKSNTSRRRVFQDDYPPAFRPADRVVISSPFEKKDGLADDEQIDIEQMVADIREIGPQAIKLDSVDDIVAKIPDKLRAGDVVVGLSGSDFDGLHQRLIDALRTDE